jgi:lantibiotic leader peptide-processing serine protease
MSTRRTILSTLGVLALLACSDQPTVPLTTRAPSLAVSGTAASIDGNYLIRFKGTTIPNSFDRDVAALGGQVIFAHAKAGVGAVRGLTPAAAATLRTKAGISDVAADDATVLGPLSAEFVPEEASEALESPTNPTLAIRYPRQWHLHVISAAKAWAEGYLGSPGVRVGILDTGLGYTYPDLVGRVDLARSKSFLSPEENARVQASFPGAHEIADLHYHGTHVGATVASNAIVAAGVTSRVTLVGLKVCAPGFPNADPKLAWQGSCPTSAVLQAILHASDLGLDVINMSLGGTFLRREERAVAGEEPAFLAIINQTMTYANRKGVTVVVSAGNGDPVTGIGIDLDHDGNGYKAYCSAPTVICVAATGPTSNSGVNGPWQNIDALAVYSNYGESAISVAAPGGNTGGFVLAGCSPFSLPFAVCQTGIFVLSSAGTSMAAPHVSGLAALLVEQYGRDPGAIRNAIQSSADDLGALGTDPIYGKGRINVARALGLPTT